MNIRQCSVLICALGLLLAGIYWRQNLDVIPLAVIPCVNITRGCGNQQLQVNFDREPQVMQPFNVSVKVPQATEVYASFAMQGMEMGFNRYRLLLQQVDIWHGQITLPVCIQGRKDWNMLLEAKTTLGVQRYQLAFTTN